MFNDVYDWDKGSGKRVGLEELDAGTSREQISSQHGTQKMDSPRGQKWPVGWRGGQEN